MLYQEKEELYDNNKPKPQVILGLTNKSLLLLSKNEANIINKTLSEHPFQLYDIDSVPSSAASFIPIYKERIVKQKLKKIKQKKIKEKKQKPITYENMLKKFKKTQKKQPKPKKEKKPSKKSIENEYYTKKLEEMLGINLNEGNNEDDDIEIDENELKQHLDVLYSISKAIENKSDRRNRNTKSKPAAERRKEIFEKMKDKLNQEQIVDIAKNILKIEQIGNQICLQPEDIKKKHFSHIEKKIKEYDEINKKNPQFISVKGEMAKTNNNLPINDEVEQIKKILSNSDLSDSLSESDSDDKDDDSL